MRYEPAVVEPKWQRYWEESRLFAAPDCDPTRPKYYILDMFPYPSGAGLHVGHPEGYTATDILARYKRMRGFNVLHPMGYDAFGLPAENYAIKTGIHPRITTAQNIGRIREQIKRLGFSYDWAREVDTTDPGYYRWTQWIFLQLFKKGLAYQDTVPINWCPSCKTGLANEEVKNGRCDRCNQLVSRRGLRQWMFRITAYAEALLDGLEALDWPEPIKKMQQDWIGRSTGADVVFALADPPAGVDPGLTIYTTRPDTLFGATYMVLSPEHALVEKITTPGQQVAVKAYVEAASHKSDLQRTELTKTKTGVFTGAYAINPVNGARVPIWIADYVLMGYGTGAIMAVPAHDQRDYEFARTFELPIVQVVRPPEGQVLPEGAAFADEGTAMNSGRFDGLSTAEFKRQVVAWLESEGRGRGVVRYKLRDWVFSRQRYWGEPIPLVHCGACGVVPVPEEELPLLLPEIERYEPTGTGESPLAAVESWVQTSCPSCHGPARRETNTMPQWAGSCWYYLRYIDARNERALADPEKERYWMPVDLYVGGAEHAVLHLLYSRFWHRVLHELGVVSTAEPFQALRNQGMILGFSYRYLEDEQGGAYPTSAGTLKEDRWTLKASGAEVMEKWVPTAEVKWEGESPRHPAHPELELEAFVTKMSKARGNVVNPDEIIDEYGADVLRLYEMFMGPFEASCPWNTRDIEGVNRFLHRAWRVFGEDRRGAASDPDELSRLRHKIVKKVTSDLETMGFNTAIAQLMTYVNELTKQPKSHPEDLKTLALLLGPFTPHFAEEVWSQLGHAPSISREAWPTYDEALTHDELVTLVVQVNGKKRGTCEVPAGIDEVGALAVAREAVASYLEGKRVVKEIYIARSKLVNVVVA
ncbi:MAG: leucine--tRNA ligase [Deltaproteobacteria bacterium]|nr:leucine--tRNA ligase [Deltaproteobacteria bacterium]